MFTRRFGALAFPGGNGAAGGEKAQSTGGKKEDEGNVVDAEYEEVKDKK